jgi:hypothetical protein
MRDILRSHSRGPRKLLHRLGLRKPLQEFNLDVSTAELLSVESAFTYADLYTMLGKGKMVVWLTPHAAVMPVDGRWIDPWMLLDRSCHIRFDVDGKKIDALARSTRHLFEICDVLILLLAASVVRSVIIDKWNPLQGLLINAPTLEYMMKQCQSLKVLKLHSLVLDEIHCRVLMSRSYWTTVNLRTLEQMLWQRPLDAIRARPSFIIVRLIILSSRMGCVEAVV